LLVGFSEALDSGVPSALALVRRDVVLFLLVKQAERERRACHLERLLSVIIHVSDQYS
jgi:hypothetical protein